MTFSSIKKKGMTTHSNVLRGIRIKFWKWTLVSRPVKDTDIPKHWKVATAVKIFGREFVLWEN